MQENVEAEQDDESEAEQDDESEAEQDDESEGFCQVLNKMANRLMYKRT